MAKDIKSVNNIEIKIGEKEIAELIGDVCTSTYGVVGLTKIKNLKSQLATILNRNNYLE
ncbi:MAG TPA: Asp23/Gls24 family envelope stress response protein, partial [Firmicutes bacterium]|nr:Asp23/Gls24 family envelope stress response protein [Bacillota bacterium]